MTFSLSQIISFTVLYLGALFVVGYLADRDKLPQRWIAHPATYVLSLGVIAGAMSINGALALVPDMGYSFVLYYLGLATLFFLTPLLLAPIFRLCRLYQLNSLADLLSFRFRSPLVGAAVTLVMVITLLPLLAMQIQVVSDSIHLLAGDTHLPAAQQTGTDMVALLFCAIITLFTMLFGTRQLGPQQQHRGLVTAMAFESLLKLLALLAIAAIAIYSVFGSFAELQLWLAQDPQRIAALQPPAAQDQSRALLLIFFAGAIAMPHIFHMTFSENPELQSLRSSSWGLPLYLLVLSLPILPITWAAQKLGSTVDPAYATLGIGQSLHNAPLLLSGYLVGLSAASAVIIVSTLAIANMCLNHLILPIQLHRSSARLDNGPDIYFHLRWLRRLLIIAIILAGYLAYRLLSDSAPLVSLGIIAFAGTLQFLPATLAAIYWPRANRNGMLTGLAGGFSIWFLALLLPTLGSVDTSFIAALSFGVLPAEDLDWSGATLASLALNCTLFLVVSLLTPRREEERISAEICSINDLNRPLRRTLGLTSPDQFKTGLAAVLGERTAANTVDVALGELQLTAQEARPYALRQLRVRLEANLSGLLGPAVAYEILQRCIPLTFDPSGSIEDISLIERRLDSSRLQFTGFVADVDKLRRYHRDTLQQLPIGVLSLGRDGEVLMWNQSMELLTGVSSDELVGDYLNALPAHWAEPLSDFARSEQRVNHKQQITSDTDREIWVSLHKAAVASSSQSSDDQVIVVEDLSDYQLLEQELLHSERLASIGRLAAGVAHEIGNPVTGISSLAQNLAYEEDPKIISDTASDILKQTERVSKIVESLVNFSHSGSAAGGATQLTALNVADCVDEAAHLLQLDSSAKPIQFINHCDREQLVMADSQKLLQVFVNLLSNARDASPANSTVDIACQSQDEQLQVTVTDTGEGIDEAIQNQIFEPFFTTKEPGSGTGLGLALVYSIMEDLHGRIQLQSPVPETGRGCRFTLELSRGEYQQEYQ